MSTDTNDDARDNFDGAWLVTEYVHEPDGTFAGVIRQRRLVEPIGEGRLRVTQICEPGPELDGHAMATFAGTWVFDLEVQGAHRHYLGPDVVGVGTEWSTGAMTGQGLWPRFGHEFESYGVLVSAERQLTGGFFSLAGRPVADIVGVAVPQSLGVEPTLDLAAPAPEIGDDWPLQRNVGPMRVAESRPEPIRRRRLWAMHDPIGNAGIRVVEETVTGQAPTVTISVR